VHTSRTPSDLAFSDIIHDFVTNFGFCNLCKVHYNKRMTAISSILTRTGFVGRLFVVTLAFVIKSSKQSCLYRLILNIQVLINP